ncbi:MAG: DUF2189 domain-containing protein [Gammaproteobacteria bacterium]|nr:DUF2189 domain-containing protein [Pseudomonadales bacterium]MCP5347167.1 DUF2189 domain-containing protein [Pseudomonadales bacterium]
MVDLVQRHDDKLFEEISLSPSDIRVRKIGINDLWDALGKGYDDFSAKPLTALYLLAIYYPLGALLFTLFAFDQEVRYLLFPLVAGFTLFGPIVAILFFGFSRSREQGEAMSLRHALRFVHSASFAPILALSVLMTALYLFWLYVAELIYYGLFGTIPVGSIGDFIVELFTTQSGWLLIAYGNFVGFLFAFAAMALSLVSFPLALDRPVTSITAASVSVRAFTENKLVLGAWGVIVVALLAVGAAMLLIGLAVVLPILGHATWHLYRKLVEI